MKKQIFTLAMMLTVASMASAQTDKNTAPLAGGSWKLSGNNDATEASKLGTKNKVNLKLYTNNLERMRIDTFGNVGIGGVAGSSTKLFIKGSNEILRTESVSLSGFNSFFENGIYRGYWGSYAGKNEDMDFGTGGTNTIGNINFTIAAVPKVTIDSIGRMGIGTTAPLAALDVRRTAPDLDVDGNTEVIRSESNSNIGFNSFYEGGVYRGYWGSYAGNAEDMDFGTGSSNGTGSVHLTIAAVPKVTIDKTGKMGIGTKLPTRKLEVYSGDIRVRDTTLRSRYIEFVNSAAGMNDWRFEHWYGNNGSMFISSSTGNFSSGNSDRAKFDTGFYKFTVYGNALATSGLWVDSDNKLKKNVKDVSNALDIINQLKPHTYNFKTDEYKGLGFNNDKQFGFVAQELEQVLPELVHTEKQPIGTNDNGERIMEDIKSVNYIQLIPILTKAFQEQSEEIQKLKDQVAQLLNTSASKNAVANNVAVSNAALSQNTPNPFASQTKIAYNLPAGFSNAQIIISDNLGKQIKQIQLTKSGTGFVNLDAASLTSGTYYYSLIVDGKKIDSKKMIASR